MKLELAIEKNVILKRDKPWSHFYFVNDHQLLCYNEHKKFESINSSNGKIEHISNKIIANISKSSITHCSSNNGHLCAFLSENYEITIWDKDKLIRTIPSCSNIPKTMERTPHLYISNNGEQVILILQQVSCRLFLWLKSTSFPTIPIQHHHKSPVCSSLSDRSMHEIGAWHELTLTNEELNAINNDNRQTSIDCFFCPKDSSIICVFASIDRSGYIQMNRIDIDWKPKVYSEKLISYTFETLRIPTTNMSPSCLVCFAHSSPILAISLPSNILLISLTTITFSKQIPINYSAIISSTHQQVFINDLSWSYDDQFLIGLTDRGALFFLNRFGWQIDLITQGECIAQGPSPFVIIHPLIGKDSEATTHLGLGTFMKSVVPLSNDDKRKQQKFSLVANTNKSLIFCSDGYRLACLTYSNRIRDRRFYDPLLCLYLTDLNKQQQEHSIFIHKTKSFDDIPKLIDRVDTESVGGGGEISISKKYGSLTSIPTDDLSELSLEDIFSAYQLLLTSSERVQHEICSCLERATRTILLSSDNSDILTPIQLSHCLTNLVLSSSFGSLTMSHISCLTKFIPLFLDIYCQQTTITNDPELLQLCILYIIEKWLQTILYIPTTPSTFELYRRQKRIDNREGNERNFRICKAIKQLELLQGTNVNLDDFLPLSVHNLQQHLQVNDLNYDRLTLLRSWYTLWLSVERKFRRDIKTPPKYLTTIRLFIQSLLRTYPSLSATSLSPYGYKIDLNNFFPPVITSVDHPLHTKGYSTLNERRKQRRRSRNSIDQTDSAHSHRRGKPPSEARKKLVLHRVLYALLEQYYVRDAVYTLNVALRRQTSLLSQPLLIDLFSPNLFQHIDTQSYFSILGHALQSVLCTLARFMARSIITMDYHEQQQQQQQRHQQLFIYSFDSACPLPNLFKTKQKRHEYLKHRMIYIDRNRLNLAIQQQKMTRFWQPLKVLELFILGQSPKEAILFAKLVGDWRTALCLASVLSPHNELYNASKSIKRTIPSYSALNAITVDGLLYTKLCEYLQIDDLQILLRRNYKQDEITSFIQNLASTLDQFLLCSTILQVPLTEMLLRRLNAIMVYLFTLIPIFISSKYYLPCPPIYSSILNTYDDDKSDITCKYETHIRLIFHRIIHIFIQLLSASRIQLSCLKWYLDYLTMKDNRRKQTTVTNEVNDSFYSIKVLLKSLRFHKLPNISDLILLYFRDFCIILFLFDTRDRLSFTLRRYIHSKTQCEHSSDQLAMNIISYATILLSFRCLVSDEIELLRVILNLFFDLTPSEKLMRALATLIVTRQREDSDSNNNAEISLIVDKLKAKWMLINPTWIELYEGFLKTIIIEDVQEDIIKHYMNDMQDHYQEEPLFDFKPKWFETRYEYGDFITMLIQQLLDTSSVTNIRQQELNNDHTKFDSKSIPLLHTMSTQLREFQLPQNLDKQYLLKQPPPFLSPREYVVFPARMIPYDVQRTMFQQAPSSVNNTTVGNFVHTPSTHQVPDVISLQHYYGHNYHNSDGNNNNTDTNSNENPLIEWDRRSDDPSTTYVRQFDESYSEVARHSIWMVGWANRGFTTSNDQVQKAGMRIPISAQFLTASALISDPQRNETVLKQHRQQTKYNNDQLDNDTDLTNVTKESDDEDGVDTQSDLPSSPRRRDASHRRNSIEDSMSIPIMSNNGGGDFGRSHDFRAPSRETGGDETPTYDPRDFPTDYYKESAGYQPRYQSKSSLSSQTFAQAASGYQQQQQQRQPIQQVQQSLNGHRFVDDSDPYLNLRPEQESDKYAMMDTYRTATSKQSPVGRYPSSRGSPSHQLSYQDLSSRRSPTKDPYSHRSSSRDLQRQQHHRQHFPSIQPSTSSVNQVLAPASIQYVPSIRLPLLRLGASITSTTSMPTQVRLPAYPSQFADYIPRTMQIPTPPRLLLPMLYLAPQPAPLVSASPRPTRTDQKKLSYVQSIMQKFSENNRSHLQLLEMRSHPKMDDTADLAVPMPASNIVTTSSDTKIEKDTSAETPRKDGFYIERDTFQTLLRDATGVNFTSAEAHYSAARQIEQQARDARRRERATMTDLPAHQILYDLQYARGGEGDERKFVNVTDIAGSHADALLALIEKDQAERERLHLHHHHHQQQPVPLSMPTTTNTNEVPLTSYHVAFNGQHTQALEQQQEHMTQLAYPPRSEQQQGQVLHQPLDFYTTEDTRQKSDLILQRRRQREQAEKQAEQLAFGNIDDDYSKRKVSCLPEIQTYEPNEIDVPLEYLIRQPRSTEPIFDHNLSMVDPISVRSTTPRSPYKQLANERPIATEATTPSPPVSSRKQGTSERPISIKTTIPRDPFSPRKPISHTLSHSASGTPRKATSPTIADRHRIARQRQQQILSRMRDEKALLFADNVLHDEPIPPGQALEEFQIEALETSFTSTVRELAGADGIINRTYDLDLMGDGDDDDDDDDMGTIHSERRPSRPMSATAFNVNQNVSHYSTLPSSLPRPSSASSATSSRQMTPMGKAIVQAKKKGPPPARSNMARKRPLSSPGDLGQKRDSVVTPVRGNHYAQARLVRTVRKSSPPAHKPTTYNERVRALNKTDGEIRAKSKSDSSDPKALMRLYGTRRVPGFYVPYEKKEPRVTKTYSERMKELQRPTFIEPQKRRTSQEEQEQELDQRPSSAPSSSVSLSDWEVDDRIKQLLADDQDAPSNKRLIGTVTPLGSLDELDDDNMDETTYSLTRVTEQTNENTYGDDLRLLQYQRSSALNTNTYGGTKVSARSSAGGDMTARDESELSRGESSIASYLDWSVIDREFPTGTQ